MAQLSRAFSSQRRLSIVVLVVLALAGLAGGLLLAQGSGAETKGRPGVLSSGSFHSISWQTKGQVSIVRQSSGDVVLQFSKNFQTKEAPELYVYAARAGQDRQKVADLRSPAGAQSYKLSAAVAQNPRMQVIVWCGECNKAWGAAWLTPSKLT